MPVLVLVLVVALAAHAAAAPTVTCHCFRDREYDPGRPGAVDPYALATARNSLLASAFGMEKGDVVRALMTGTSPEDLWVSHWAASRLGTDPRALRAARAERGSWKQALAGADATRLGPAFARALAEGRGDTALADAAVDEVLVARLRVDPGALRALRQAGATSPEAVLACLLSPRLRKPAASLVAEARRGSASWGSLLREGGLGPKDIEGEVKRALR